MTNIHLIQIPYHYGFLAEREGTGLAADRYVDAGIASQLAAAGHQVTIHRLSHGRTPADLFDAVRLMSGRLANQVQEVVAESGFPLVLGGGCSTSLGILSALPPSVGIVWFDAHGDYNTPETSPSGFFDGMPLAIATGLGHQELRAAFAAQPPIPGSQVVLAGIQQLDPGEVHNLRRENVAVVAYKPWAEGFHDDFQAALASLRRRVSEVYLHIDIDVLNAEAAPSVDYREGAGLSLDEALTAVVLVGEQFRVRAAALTAFNPALANPERTERSGLRLIQALADLSG